MNFVLAKCAVHCLIFSRSQNKNNAHFVICAIMLFWSKTCLTRRLVDKMLHDPRSSIRPRWVGFGKHAPCRPPFPPVLILGQDEGDATFCHFAALIFEATPTASILNLGGEGGEDCTSGPKTGKIDATFRPSTVAPNSLLHFCEIGEKVEDRIAGIGKREKGREKDRQRETQVYGNT